MAGQLAGRVAAITGAARGIGAAIARAMAAEGARLVLADLDGLAVQAFAATLPHACALRADVSSTADAEAIAQLAIDAYGRLDILVNNAGIGISKPFMDTTPEDVQRAMGVNLVGSMLCAQAALRRMVPAGYGRIVNISSISGQRGNAGRTAYGASKAAVELMTRVMTAELAQPGLTVNAIAPGAVESEMSAALHDARTRQSFHDRTPQGRYGTVDEIAAAAVFLASEAAGYVCGQVLNVDGGFVSAGFTNRGGA